MALEAKKHILWNPEPSLKKIKNSPKWGIWGLIWGIKSNFSERSRDILVNPGSRPHRIDMPRYKKAKLPEMTTLQSSIGPKLTKNGPKWVKIHGLRGPPGGHEEPPYINPGSIYGVERVKYTLFLVSICQGKAQEVPEKSTESRANLQKSLIFT